MDVNQEVEEKSEITLLPKERIQEAYQNTVIRLISRHEYYAHILLQLKVSFDDNFPTLGVTIRNSQVHMIIGTDFFLKSTSEQRVFYLMHEMAHIILGHLGLERRGNPDDHKIMNIAMDTAIHEILTQAKTLFPEETDMKPCTVESIRKLTQSPDIKNYETTEYYFNFLKQLKNDLIDQLGKFDEHGFAEGNEEGNSVDIGKALTVGLLEKAKTQAGAGNVPGEALLTIEKFKKSVTNWKAILRRFTNSMVDDTTRTTRNKRNRRYGFLVPGRKKSFKPKVVAIVDTSGSMDQTRLTGVWSELVKMEKQGYEIMLIEADAKVQKVREFSSRGDIKFSGGGGTLYQEALDVASTLKPDVVIYLTDMDPADDPVKPRYPVIWAAVARGGFKPTFGVVVDVGEEK